MDFKGDVRFFLLLGAGVVAAAWGFANVGPIAQLTQTGTNGYVSMVRGLEPSGSGGGVLGGAGNFSQNTGMLSGQPYTVAGWN